MEKVTFGAGCFWHVEEEFRQSCFHITVYKSYASPSTTPDNGPRRAQASTTTQIGSDDK